MKNLWCHPGLRSSSRRRGSIHLVFALFLAFFFVACGDDDSDFAVRPSDGSSSSVCEDCDDGSSSSVTPKSNDSETSVSSSSTKSSSSSVESSSSSRIGCKTETEDNCEYGELLDDRDGQTYKTVKIGDQWWMAENLNYAYLQPTEELDSSSFCYNDSAEYCERYGRLYIWSAAMDSAAVFSADGAECGYKSICSSTCPVRGVCPKGWHLPSIDEWDDMVAYVGGDHYAGRMLKTTTEWFVYDDNIVGIDAYAFSGWPSGRRDNFDKFDEVGRFAFYWSASEVLADIEVLADNAILRTDAYNIELGFNYMGVQRSDYYKSGAMSVRCIQD